MRSPSVQNFVEVFDTADFWLQKQQRRLLQFHLRAPDHTITATELSEKMGYSTYNPILATYGRLAAQVSKKLHLLGIDTSGIATEPAASVLVRFEREGSEQHWKWIMHPELVEALQSLGWK